MIATITTVTAEDGLTFKADTDDRIYWCSDWARIRSFGDIIVPVHGGPGTYSHTELYLTTDMDDLISALELKITFSGSTGELLAEAIA